MLHALTSQTIPESVTSIGESAFSNCKGLKSLTIPASVTSIGYKAFSDCSGLTSAVIPNSVNAIGYMAFSGCSSITSVTLPTSITAISDECFSGCTSLEKVVLPPYVETIGVSAFAGNSMMTSVTMGHSVKSIGDKAFDGCPSTKVYITTQTPPTATDETFSYYAGKLYVQGEAAQNAYHTAAPCWNRFSSETMIEPTGFDTGDTQVPLEGKPGDTFQLTAKLRPENVTLPYVFWSTTNPDIATVDHNGLVTLHVDIEQLKAEAASRDSEANACEIVAESLYADGPKDRFTVYDPTVGVEDIMDDFGNSGEIDFDAPVEVYTLQGMFIGTDAGNLAPGIYIIRQGKNVKKIAVK